MRSQGVAAVVDSAASSMGSDSLTMLEPLALAARRISLLGQDAEGYAKACTAFGRAEIEGLDTAQRGDEEEGGLETKVLTLEKPGSFDVSSVYGDLLGKGEWTRSEAAGGHWSVFQELDKVAEAVGGFL